MTSAHDKPVIKENVFIVSDAESVWTMRVIHIKLWLMGNTKGKKNSNPWCIYSSFVLRLPKHFAHILN